MYWSFRLTRTSPNTIPATLNYKDTEELYKKSTFKNSFLLIFRKFLDRLWQKKGLRPAKMQGQDWPPVLQKQSAPRFGLLRREYLWGSILFTKTLLLPNPVSRPGCYD